MLDLICGEFGTGISVLLTEKGRAVATYVKYAMEI